MMKHFLLLPKWKQLGFLLLSPPIWNSISFKMDVNSDSLNGFMKKEVYAKQPLDFEDIDNSSHVFKLDKSLYELKQAHKAW